MILHSMNLESPWLVVGFLLIFVFQINCTMGLQNCLLRSLKKQQIWFNFCVENLHSLTLKGQHQSSAAPTSCFEGSIAYTPWQSGKDLMNSLVVYEIDFFSKYQFGSFMCATGMQCHSSFYFLFCTDRFNLRIKVFLYFPLQFM